QLLIESLLIAAAGGALSLLLAYYSSGGMVALMSMGRSPLILDLHPDLRVLVFTALVSTLAAILFGLAPALGATRLDLTPALKQTSQGSGKVQNKVQSNVRSSSFSLLLPHRRVQSSSFSLLLPHRRAQSSSNESARSNLQFSFCNFHFAIPSSSF